MWSGCKRRSKDDLDDADDIDDLKRNDSRQ